jgi:carbamoylphosphate synthase large subunit
MKGKYSMSTILVSGLGGPAGRNVANLLLERGIKVVGVDMRPLEATDTLFEQVPAANDADFLPAIHRIALREKVDWIIPTVSEELIVFARDWRWQAELPVLISRAEAVETANDKYLTSLALSSKGVAVPRFMLPTQARSVDEVAEKIGWPCISKPRVGRGGREVALRTPQDWPALAALGERYILQEFAEGTDYAPNIFSSANGYERVVVLEKTELKEGIVGNAKSVQRVDAPDVASLAAAAAHAVGLTGPLDIDIRRRKDGIPVVLEINARFGANIRYAPEVLDVALNSITIKA